MNHKIYRVYYTVPHSLSVRNLDFVSTCFLDEIAIISDAEQVITEREGGISRKDRIIGIKGIFGEGDIYGVNGTLNNAYMG